MPDGESVCFKSHSSSGFKKASPHWKGRLWPNDFIDEKKGFAQVFTLLFCLT